MIAYGRSALVAGMIVMITGCGGGADPSTPAPETTSPSASASASPSPTSFGLEGCPIADHDACGLALEVAGALVAGDAELITSLSRTGHFVCDEEVDLPLPDCTPGAVLTGHPVIDSRPVIDVLDAAAYAAHNERLLADVDPTFSDDHGDGSVRVLGVGTCGPDIAERRSYHVAFTAAVGSDHGVDRLVGSYELNLLDSEWLIGTAFLDTYDAWLDAYSDPLREHGCNPAPWH